MTAYEVDKLLSVIANVHREHADDLCWMPADVNRIFAAAGLPPQDLRVGDKVAMRKNCDRYVDALCDGGGWKSYAELEAENEELRKQLQQALAAVKVVEFNKGDADCPCPPIGQPG